MPTVVGPVDDIVFIKSALMAPATDIYVNSLERTAHPPYSTVCLPFKRQNIARCNRNRVCRLRVSEQIAAQINARQVLHRGAVVAGSDRAVIRRCPNTYERLVSGREREERRVGDSIPTPVPWSTPFTHIDWLRAA